MAGKTQSHEVAVLNVLRGTTLNGFNSYVGLYSAAPTDAGGGTERAGQTRQLAGFGAPSGSPSQMANVADIDFPVDASGFTGAAVGLFDAPTAGNLVAWVAASFTIAAGGFARIAAGALTYQED